MRSENPEILRIGGAMLITPKGAERLPVDVWADFATLVLLEPEPVLASEWISRLETRLGVTDQHRQVMADRAVAAVESREEKRRRLLDEHRRASQIGAPMRDPEHLAAIGRKALEVEQSKVAVSTAAAQLEAAGPKDAKKCRRALKAAKGAQRKLEDELAALRRKEQEQTELYGEANDPILMAKGRGEDVIAGAAETAEVARDEYGARLLRDDGLPVLVYGTGLRAKRLTGYHHAFANGYLGSGMAAERLYNMARIYREAFEIAEGQTSSGGEGGGGFGPKAPQPRLVEAGQQLADMRSHLTTRQRDVLDLVCGKDMRLREAADVLRAGFPASQRALRGGLAQARESLAQAQMGTGSRHAANVRAVTRILAGMKH